MRNSKLVWSVNIVLAAAVLILAGLLLIKDSGTPPESSEPAPVEDSIVAKIGEHAILKSELQRKVIKKYGFQVLEELLDRQVIQLEADEQGIVVSESEITRELEQMSIGYESEEEYYRSMKKQLGLDKEELIEDVHYKLLLEKLATSDIPVSEDEIDQYIQNNSKEYKDSIQLRIAQIITSTLDQANDIRQQYENGVDFGELAKQRSLDTFSAIDGGDLGWLEEDDPFVNPSILNTALSLQVGDISEPIPLDEGYAVIRLTNHKIQSKGTEDQIRDKVRKELSLQKAPPLRDVVSNLRKKRNAVILDNTLNS